MFGALGACAGGSSPPAVTAPMTETRTDAGPRSGTGTGTGTGSGADAGADADAGAVAIVRHTRRFYAGGGWTEAGAWKALEPVLPLVDDCYRALLARSVDRRGPMNLQLAQTKTGLEPNVGAPFDDAFKACVIDALKKVAAPPVVSPGGTPTMRLELDIYPAALAPELRAAHKGADIVKAPDGSCSEVLRADCPPNKICAADEHKPVKCP